MDSHIDNKTRSLADARSLVYTLRPNRAGTRDRLVPPRSRVPALAQESGSGSTGYADLRKRRTKPVEPLILFHPYPDHRPRGGLCPPCPLPLVQSLQVANGS